VPKLSVTILTKNEAGNIAAALESVAWADEILVVDAESSDDTVSIAQRYTDRVIVRPWPGFPQQKNYAASLASHDWILSLDADERVTPSLADEIRRVLTREPAAGGYRMRRVTRAFGRWIRSTDWYPDWQLRLYDRRLGQWDESRQVHESVRLAREPARLDGEIEHFAYRDLSHHVRTIDRYTSLAAADMAAQGRRATALDLLVHPPAAFTRNYLLRRGIREGRAGLVISTMNAWYVFMKYAKLWELENQSSEVEGRK
jgi:(heptosyl)LPS beta-1,4-glucosyltransferase